MFYSLWVFGGLDGTEKSLYFNEYTPSFDIESQEVHPAPQVTNTSTNKQQFILVGHAVCYCHNNNNKNDNGLSVCV